MKHFAPPDETITSSLARIVLFEDLSPEQLAALARILRRQRFPRDSVIAAQGEAGEVAFTIIKGGVDITVAAADGRQCLLAELGPLDYFGEMALLDDGD